MKDLAALAFIALLVGLVILIKCEHRPQGYAVVQTRLPAEANANRLFSPCPLTPKNIPPRQETTA